MKHFIFIRLTVQSALTCGLTMGIAALGLRTGDRPGCCACIFGLKYVVPPRICMAGGFPWADSGGGGKAPWAGGPVTGGGAWGAAAEGIGPLGPALTRVTAPLVTFCNTIIYVIHHYVTVTSSTQSLW